MKQGAGLISACLVCFGLLSGCSTQIVTKSDTAKQPTSDEALEQCWQQVAARSELASCLQKVLSKAGAEADKAEKEADHQSQTLDMTTSADINAQRNFRAAKRSFHQFRERFCRWHESMTVGGGSGAGDSYRACYVETTRWWTQLLDRQSESN